METMYFNNVQGSYCYVSKLIFVTLFLNSSWWVLMLVASAKVRWRRVPAACNRGGPTYTNPSACPPPPWPFKHLLPYYTGHPACFTYIAPLYTRHTFRTYMSRHLQIYIYILSRNPSCMLNIHIQALTENFCQGWVYYYKSNWVYLLCTPLRVFHAWNWTHLLKCYMIKGNSSLARPPPPPLYATVHNITYCTHCIAGVPG